MLLEVMDSRTPALGAKLNGNKFELQRRAAAKPEGEDRHNGRKNRHHARDGMPPPCRKLQPLSALWRFNFEQGHPLPTFCAIGGSLTRARSKSKLTVANISGAGP
jgi:hypothetical protein